LIPAIKNYISRRILKPDVPEKESADAYDLWSANYDRQPGNLMLDLDEVLFSKLLKSIELENKNVADIGCGTGRHWNKILAKNPALLTGFDVSDGMLARLKEKYPAAYAYKITDDLFMEARNAPFDVILSTLTVAHIGNLERALNRWCEILKADAEIVITDFHPKMLAFGGKRTFRYKNKSLAVRNYVYPVETIKDVLQGNGFNIVKEEEFKIDETTRSYYAEQNALPVYEQFKGFPVIYGVHLKRGNDPE
jgi:ubiquinone/menaquinone biosynthesis C-methylase UbiE